MQERGRAAGLMGRGRRADFGGECVYVSVVISHK